MLTKCLDFVFNKASSSAWFAAAGIATFATIGCLDWLIARSIIKFKEKLSEEQRYMKGVTISSYNGIDAIEVADNLLIPRIQRNDEVLIKVKAAGIDCIDLKICHGYGRAMRSHLRLFSQDGCNGFPVVLGRDCSGVVINIGNHVTTVSKGDHVWAVSSYCEEGMMAEYVVVKESQVALKPATLSFAEAASLPYIAVLTWNALVIQGQLKPDNTAGKRILVHASNKAFGLFALQLLKAWGGHLTATVPTTGLPMCRRLSSDDVIVYSVTDFQAELRKRKRYDVILNSVGTILHRRCLEMCAKGGRVITLITTPLISDKYGVLLGWLLSSVMHSCFWIKKILLNISSKVWWKTIVFDNEALKAVSGIIEKYKIQPVIEVYFLENAKAAFQQLEMHQAVGKPVISFEENKN